MALPGARAGMLAPLPPLQGLPAAPAPAPASVSTAPPPGATPAAAAQAAPPSTSTASTSGSPQKPAPLPPLLRGSLLAMPLIILNMGTEMIYILEQRLRAQSIAPERSKKVLGDVVKTMLSPKFLGELYKPTEVYSNRAVRAIFERLAHSSIMRLNRNSMDKLYDLMSMGWKFQVLRSGHPEALLEITTLHLRTLRGIMEGTSVVSLIDAAAATVQAVYSRLSLGELWKLKQTLCRFLQDRRVKVSLFLLDAVQLSDATILLNNRGHPFAGPPGAGAAGGGATVGASNTAPMVQLEKPGIVRYFVAPGAASSSAGALLSTDILQGLASKYPLFPATSSLFASAGAGGATAAGGGGSATAPLSSSLSSNAAGKLSISQSGLSGGGASPAGAGGGVGGVGVAGKEGSSSTFSASLSPHHVSLMPLGSNLYAHRGEPTAVPASARGAASSSSSSTAAAGGGKAAEEEDEDPSSSTGGSTSGLDRTDKSESGGAGGGSGSSGAKKGAAGAEDASAQASMAALSILAELVGGGGGGGGSGSGNGGGAFSGKAFDLRFFDSQEDDENSHYQNAHQNAAALQYGGSYLPSSSTAGAEGSIELFFGQRAEAPSSAFSSSAVSAAAVSSSSSSSSSSDQPHGRLRSMMGHLGLEQQEAEGKQAEGKQAERAEGKAAEEEEEEDLLSMLDAAGM